MITTGILDPLVAGMVTPEKFVTMLHDGWVDDSLVERPPDARGLSRRALGGWWQAFLASEQDFDRCSISFPADKPIGATLQPALPAAGLAVAIAGGDPAAATCGTDWPTSSPSSNRPAAERHRVSISRAA